MSSVLKLARGVCNTVILRQQVRNASFIAVRFTNGTQRIINLDNIDSMDLQDNKIYFNKISGHFLASSRYFAIVNEEKETAKKQFDKIMMFLMNSRKLVDIDKTLEMEIDEGLKNLTVKDITTHPEPEPEKK